MAAIGYLLLERMLIACNGADSILARAVGSDLKEKLSLSIYAAAILLAFVQPWIAITLYIAVASLLLIAAYDRPFTGEISVGPKLLKQVISSESAITQP